MRRSVSIVDGTDFTGDSRATGPLKCCRPKSVLQSDESIMHRNKAEKIRDNLIGEAVFLLLKTHGNVESQALAARLRAMADEECDPCRKKALLEASIWVLEKDNRQVSSGPSGLDRNARRPGNPAVINVDNLQKKH